MQRGAHQGATRKGRRAQGRPTRRTGESGVVGLVEAEEAREVGRVVLVRVEAARDEQQVRPEGAYLAAGELARARAQGTQGRGATRARRSVLGARARARTAGATCASKAARYSAAGVSRGSGTLTRRGSVCSVAPVIGKKRFSRSAPWIEQKRI